ncbi:MAG: malate/lactate/ureidoglycolate dehydrogenase [Acidobacteriota bacterium]
MQHFSSEQLLLVSQRLLEAGGSSADEASVVSDHLVRANLLGHDSHGIGMLPFYCGSLDRGTLLPNQEPVLATDHGAILAFDGQRGYGQAVGRVAMEHAIERCRATGLVAMTLRNAHHIGRVGTYGEQSLGAGFASIHFVNVTDHDPLVAPFLGKEARFSTNPVCLAMPSPAGREPILLDMATSRVALGKVRVAHNKGEPMGSELLLDADGQRTDDPAVMFRRPQGALTTVGDHKGYGLALFGELFGGLLSGGGTIQPGNERRGGIVNNMLTVILDPSKLVEGSYLESELGDLVDYLKSTDPADEKQPVLIPGEPERLSHAERTAEGIPVDDTTWQQIGKGGELLGLEAGWHDALLAPSSEQAPG